MQHIVYVMFQVLIQTLWLGTPLEEAVSLSRLHHQLSPNYLAYEDNFPTVSALNRFVHVR